MWFNVCHKTSILLPIALSQQAMFLRVFWRLFTAQLVCGLLVQIGEAHFSTFHVSTLGNVSLSFAGFQGFQLIFDVNNGQDAKCLRGITCCRLSCKCEKSEGLWHQTETQPDVIVTVEKVSGRLCLPVAVGRIICTRIYTLWSSQPCLVLVDVKLRKSSDTTHWCYVHRETNFIQLICLVLILVSNGRIFPSARSSVVSTQERIYKATNVVGVCEGFCHLLVSCPRSQSRRCASRSRNTAHCRSVLWNSSVTSFRTRNEIHVLRTLLQQWNKSCPSVCSTSKTPFSFGIWNCFVAIKHFMWVCVFRFRCDHVDETGEKVTTVPVSRRSLCGTLRMMVAQATGTSTSSDFHGSWSAQESQCVVLFCTCCASICSMPCSKFAGKNGSANDPHFHGVEVSMLRETAGLPKRNEGVRWLLRMLLLGVIVFENVTVQVWKRLFVVVQICLRDRELFVENVWSVSCCEWKWIVRWKNWWLGKL